MSTFNQVLSASSINSRMINVYKWVFLSVVISMVVAFCVSNIPLLLEFFFTGILKWIVIFSPLVAVIIINLVLKRNPSKEIAQFMLLGFSTLMGLSFAILFSIYKIESIFTAFMSAAILFGVMSFYGYFTKKSLDSVGKFMFIGLITVIIAAIVNIFINSGIVSMVISTLSIIIFTALTAYDTQKIREMIMYGGDEENIEVIGALTLYLDFINIFINLLQLTGNKNE